MRNSTEERYKQNANHVIDYISSHLHEPLQLDVIAGQINVSQRQLLRIMRLSLDEPLSAYVARQRMERTVMYMQTEELNLVALAEMVGYDTKLQAFYNTLSIYSEYLLRHGVAFEEYVNSPQDTKEEDLLTKIFIPIE